MRTRSGWILAGAAVLMGTVGCSKGDAPKQAPSVAEVQQQSEQAMSRARDAQDEAREQREGSLDARKDVAEARQDLREAQQSAEQERQKALEAQRHAEQQAQVAYQQAQRATEQLQQQQQQAQAQPGSTLTISGQVAATQADRLLLRSPTGESMRLFVDSDTQIFVNGRRAEITELPQGTEVRASYRNIGVQEPLALRVEVLGQATGGSGASGQEP